MGSFLKDRHVQIISVFVILICLLIGRLFYLSVVQNKSWANRAENLSTKTIYTPAARGQIYDRYGRLIAGNKQIFVANIVAADVDEKNINDVSLNLINLLEKNGDTYKDEFPIKISKKGNFYYTYDKDIKDWLKEQELNENLSAEEAFKELRSRENIDASLSNLDAQKKLQTEDGIYPPISVKKMQYTSKLELYTFLEGFHINKNASAKEAFKQLREKYDIDSSLSDADARKIFVVRNAIKNLGYQSYMPAEIASGISQQSVIELQENSDKYPGVQVARQAVRYYPNGSTASHVIGYMGTISESEKDKYIKKGYSATDLIGREGIEKYYESTLKGKSGSETVEVNAEGQETRKIKSTEPEPGNDVTLTIDMNLQKVAEESLEKAIKGIQHGGSFTSKYGNFGYSHAYPNCSSGAAVAVDVKTGQVLALASYPGYDPNLFSQGISDKDWDSLQPKNPRDPLSARPLYNIATMSPVQPGSTFKPITCLSALNKGFSPNTYLNCAGYIKMGSRSFGCWIWNEYHSMHGALNMRQALERSCNYFMYDLGGGRNFATGGGLGVKHDISDVMKYADSLGMNEKTGLELSEAISGVPSEETKRSTLETQLRYYIKVNANKLFGSKIAENDSQIKKRQDTMVKWISEEMSRDDIIDQLEKLDVKDNQVEKFADILRDNYVNQGSWTTGDKLNLSIGQGENAYTPAQMARYVSVVANGGTLHDLTLTKEIENGTVKADKGTKVKNTNSNAWKVIQDGMHLVAQGGNGTARKVFGGFHYSVGAKTGTAQNSGRINTPDEVEYVKQHLSGIAPGLSWDKVEAEMKRLMKKDPKTYSSKDVAVRRAVMNLSDATSEDIDKYKKTYSNYSWFIAFGPTDDPQIAVSVLLVQGGAGAYSGPVAREIIGEYMDFQKQYKTGDYSMTAAGNDDDSKSADGKTSKASDGSGASDSNKASDSGGESDSDSGTDSSTTSGNTAAASGEDPIV